MTSKGEGCELSSPLLLTPLHFSAFCLYVIATKLPIRPHPPKLFAVSLPPFKSTATNHLCAPLSSTRSLAVRVRVQLFTPCRTCAPGTEQLTHISPQLAPMDTVLVVSVLLQQKTSYPLIFSLLGSVSLMIKKNCFRVIQCLFLNNFNIVPKKTKAKIKAPKRFFYQGLVVGEILFSRSMASFDQSLGFFARPNTKTEHSFSENLFIFFYQYIYD